ncbi:hypothetical protein GS979_07180 [Rhodococcus hoagii]|nr:hypothetical protein [Prescottella equi]NKW46194.1 hypothetical protein [Prescottella equi]
MVRDRAEGRVRHLVPCTNRIIYAGDPRSNAEINSIGATTGYCPETVN